MDADKNRPPAKKKRRKRCVNHPKRPAVARCEVCEKPICKECIAHYEGARICGETCWNEKVYEERKRLEIEERLRRKKKEAMATRAVTLGLWAVLLIIAGAIGVFIYAKISDHSGDKLWELTDPIQFSTYLADQYSDTILLVSADGELNAIDGQTQEKRWSIKKPEGAGHLRPIMIDQDRCVMYGREKIFLYSSSRATPVWELNMSGPARNREIIIHEDSLYLASSSSSPLFQMSSRAATAASTLVESMLSPETPEMEDEKKNSSFIVSADINTGAEQWSTELEEIRISGLLADTEHVYAAGYKPYSYEDYFRTREQDPIEESDADEMDEEENRSGNTQLWSLNAGTGKPEWKLDCSGRFLLAPKMSDEGLVFSTKENIYLISPEGSIKWTQPFPDTGIYSFRVCDDRLLICTNNGFLLCMDMASGENIWAVRIGTATNAIAASHSVAVISGLVEIRKDPLKVIPTKRWEGSKDLLAKALKSSKVKLEPAILGINIETGEQMWSLPKREGEFTFASGLLYMLSYSTQYQFMNASADPSDISKTISTLGAYNYLTGERIWERAIDGYASGLRVAQRVALVRSRPDVMSLASDGGGRGPARLIAISLQ
jgi:outer membrane protein assembly factor BamB